MPKALNTQKQISPEDHLAAFALFTMATEHYAKLREFERALARKLGIAWDDYDGSHLTDVIYGEEGGSEKFDTALVRMGIVRADEQSKEKTP